MESRILPNLLPREAGKQVEESQSRLLGVFLAGSGLFFTLTERDRANLGGLQGDGAFETYRTSAPGGFCRSAVYAKAAKGLRRLLISSRNTPRSRLRTAARGIRLDDEAAERGGT